MLRRVVYFTLLIGVLTGCQFQKLRKTGSWEEKYEAALSYYEIKDYYRSNLLLEDILPIIRGTKEAELANFYYPYTYFYQDQYILSAHYFNLFAEVYGRSEYAMEAQFMHAFSLYKQSPEYKLDQTPTYEAIAALQIFINQFPFSDYADQADNLIDELQVKLEKKAYENAKLYYKVRRYKSATVAFENFQKNYPDSDYNEEIIYLNIKTWYDYASASVRAKQEERFQQVVDIYIDYVDRYPKSIYLKEAEGIYSKSTKELTKFAALKRIN